MNIPLGKAEEMLQGHKELLKSDAVIPNKTAFQVSKNLLILKAACEPLFQIMEEKRNGFHEKYTKGKAKKDKNQANIDFLNYRKELLSEEIEVVELNKININFLNTEEYKNTILPKGFFVTCFDVIEGEPK